MKLLSIFKIFIATIICWASVCTAETIDTDPIAIIDQDVVFACAGEVFTATCTQSYDPDGEDITGCYWGLYDENMSLVRSINFPTFWANIDVDGGNYYLFLRVRDGSGNYSADADDFENYAGIRVVIEPTLDADILAPGDDQKDVTIYGDLNWTSDSTDVACYNVYVGYSYDDVDVATYLDSPFEGSVYNSRYAPDDLWSTGSDYYWRVDTVVGSGPVWMEDSGNALSLDGVDDYVEIAQDSFDPNTFDPNESFGLFMWVNLSQKNDTGDCQVILGHDNGDCLLARGSDSQTGNYNKLISCFGGQEFVSNESVFDYVSAWYHVGLTYNKNTEEAKLYVNGSEVGKRSNIIVGNFVDNLLLGAGAGTNVTNWDGLIDKVRIYRCCPYEFDIKVLAGRRNGVEPESLLCASYDFEGASSVYAVDSAGLVTTAYLRNGATKTRGYLGGIFGDALYMTGQGEKLVMRKNAAGLIQQVSGSQERTISLWLTRKIMTQIISFLRLYMIIQTILTMLHL